MAGWGLTMRAECRRGDEIGEPELWVSIDNEGEADLVGVDHYGQNERFLRRVPDGAVERMLLDEFGADYACEMPPWLLDAERVHMAMLLAAAVGEKP